MPTKHKIPPEDKRKQILQAARRLLVAGDFQDVSLDQVAKKAGVAKGTLFLYYKSKDEIVSSAFAELADQVAEGLTRTLETGKAGRALLEAAVLEVCAHFERNRDFMSIGRMPGCGDRSAEKLHQKFSENQERLAAILKRVSQVVPLNGDFRFLAAFLIGLCRSTMVYQTLTGKALSLEERAQRVVDFFLRGALKR